MPTAPRRSRKPSSPKRAGRGRNGEGPPLLRLTLEPPGLTVAGGGTSLEITTTDRPAAANGARVALRGDVRGGLLRVEQDGVTLAGLVVSFPRSRLTFDGGFQSASHGMRAQLQVHADPLDLDDFLDRLAPVRAAVTRRPSPGARSRRGGRKAHWPEVSAHLDLRRVQFRRRTIDTIAGDLKVTRGTVALSPISFRTAGGSFQGSIEGPSPKRSGSRVRGTLKAPDPAPFLELAGLPSIASGALDAELDVVFPASRGWKVGGRGHFRIDLAKGRLHTVQLLAEVLSPLIPGMVSGVLSPFRRLVELDALGTRFDRVRFEGELKPGKIHLHTALIEAFGLLVQATGTMSLGSGALDLKGSVRIDATLLDWIGVERIMGPPIFTIPVTVRGSLPTPRILPDVDELKKLASALSLRRLPGRLLGDVNQRIRSFAGLKRAAPAPVEAPPKASARRSRRAKAARPAAPAKPTRGRKSPPAAQAPGSAE